MGMKIKQNKVILYYKKNWPFLTKKLASKHINVQCFFAIETIEKKEIKMIYYLTRGNDY